MEIRPSQIVMVRRADVLIRNGLEEDAWIDVMVHRAANPRVLRGSPSVVEAFQGLEVLKVMSGRVDRRWKAALAPFRGAGVVSTTTAGRTSTARSGSSRWA